MTDRVNERSIGKMQARVYSTAEAMGLAAADNTAKILTDAVRKNGHARVIFATGNSQLAFVGALAEHAEIPWDRITAFHMDEYVGISDTHPASFQRWIRERIEAPFHPVTVHYIQGDVPDAGAECRRYEDLVRALPIDLVCMGIGENGHIAFNDPPVADFQDPTWAKAVPLDEASRRQQVGEGHFPTLEDVPTHAITLTVPALLAPRSLQVVAPERRKAEAVRQTASAPVNTACPATILRDQPHAVLFLDAESASLLG